MKEIKEVRETFCAIHVPLSMLGRWLMDNDCEQAWLDGFEDGVSVDGYWAQEDCETDTPWCMPWTYESEDCDVEILKDWIEEDGLEGCVYRAAKAWGEYCADEIAEALEEEDEEEGEEEYA